MKNEIEVRDTIDNVIGALVYLEQTTGVVVHQRIFDMLNRLETLVFDNGDDGGRQDQEAVDEHSGQLAFSFADPDDVD